MLNSKLLNFLHSHHIAATTWNREQDRSEAKAARKERLKAAVMSPKTRSLAARYGLALGVTGIVLVLDLLLKTFFNISGGGLFIVAAMVAAWYGGFGPGVAVVATADLCNVVFFYNPHFSLALGVHGTERLVLFTGVGLMVSWLTARKRSAEAALQELNTRLEDRVRSRTIALQESNEQLEGFCRTLAHDLRAPARSMQGFAYLLLEDHGGKLDEEGRDCAKRICASAERMGELILDLLAYARLARAQFRLQRINLGQTVEGALRGFAGEIEVKRATVAVASPFPAVLGDQTTVEDALANLISNALKFTSPNVTPRIRIWAEEEDDRVRVWVADNGIGIEPQHQERIFGVFERLHQRAAYPGTGIGLAMVRKAMERMGGTVGVESRVGKGSRFWIELPKG